MPALIRKQVSLSRQNLSRLRQWANYYDVSDSELVRRAIQAYDPEERQASISQMEEEAADALLNHIESAIGSALKAVESTNERVEQALASLKDVNRRAAIILEVRQELDENPGFLDEVSKLMTGVGNNSLDRS